MAIDQHFRLFDLPAELRNEIYQMVFQGTTIVLSTPAPDGDDRWRAHKARRSLYRSEPRASMTLLHANRQLRAESQPIFHSHSKFYFTSEYALAEWLKSLDAKCLVAVQHVRIIHWITMRCARVYPYPIPTGVLHDKWHERKIRLTRFLDETLAGIGFDRRVVGFEFWGWNEGEKVYPWSTVVRAS